MKKASMAIKRPSRASRSRSGSKDNASRAVIVPDQMPEAIAQRRRIRERFHDSKAKVIKANRR